MSNLDDQKLVDETERIQSGMESFGDNDDGAWEDPNKCCGCIPIKIGMYMLAIGSWVGLIFTFVRGWKQSEVADNFDYTSFGQDSPEFKKLMENITIFLYA